jgi:alpha-L-arabinofuranosidase
VRAQKLRGNEGFMLMFGFQNEDIYNWFNIGGWSNSKNNIEQGNGGGRIQLTAGKDFTVENGRWYDLQVDVDGDSITCYIDGKLEFGARLQHSMMKGVFASTTIDEKTNELIIKVVNTGWGPTDGTINLQNCQAASATLQRLSSAEGTDENTMNEPEKIIPRMADVHLAQQGSKILFDIPSYSINIIRAKLK